METKDNIHINGTKRKGHAGAILLTICIVILIGVAAFLGYMYYREKQKVEHATEENTTYKAQVEELNTKVSSLEDKGKVIEANKMTEVAKIIEFDSTKGKKVMENTSYIGLYKYGEADFKDFRFKVSKDGKALVDKFHNDNTGSADLDIAINGIEGNVVDIIPSMYADGAAAYVIFLDNKGKVYYMDIQDIQSSSDNLMAKPVKELPEIVRIMSCKTERSANGGTSFIAIDKDGYFYDIMAIVLGLAKNR